MYQGAQFNTGSVNLFYDFCTCTCFWRLICIVHSNGLELRKLWSVIRTMWARVGDILWLVSCLPLPLTSTDISKTNWSTLPPQDPVQSFTPEVRAAFEAYLNGSSTTTRNLLNATTRAQYLLFLADPEPAYHRKARPSRNDSMQRPGLGQHFWYFEQIPVTGVDVPQSGHCTGR